MSVGSTPLLPGRTIGIVGGGQLGRMLGQAAQTLGYRVHVYDPQPGCPAAAVANREVNAPFEDGDALERFGRGADVVTYEFENIGAEPLARLAAAIPVRPSAEVLRICQNRSREKAWLRANQLPHAPYAEALAGGIEPAVRQVGLPCVVKTADFGYDGKGQMRIDTEEELKRAAERFKARRSVVERWIDFRAELSVIVARTAQGAARAFPVSENIHTRHILDLTVVPARFDPEVIEQAERLALDIAERLEVVGLIAVEMFLTARGEVLVNELAPRPHNSGHWSIDGCETSQFEQHVRAIAGLPLGPVGVRSPTVMVNLLGDLWLADGKPREPDWLTLLADPRVKLHLYGKTEPRPGRKMGHFTVRGATAETALAAARELKSAL